MPKPSFFKRGLAAFGTLIIIGAASFYGGLRIGSTGSLIDSHYRATAVVNPDSIAAGGATTTNVTLTGAAVGDHCNAAVTGGDLLSTTSTVVTPTCRVSATNVVQVLLNNASGTAAFNAGTSTLSVQTWGY